jgi:DNA-binding XRE family transcriptional regulator
MKKKANRNKPQSFEELLDHKYGKKGTQARDLWEQEYEAFKIGVIIHELRKKRNLTQQELAEKCGTTKSYISRIENDASDIRLSTLIRIIRLGLGANLHLRIE